MNALNATVRILNDHDAHQVFVAATSNTPSRPPRRERDFGVGYGSSSGYAAPRPYVADSSPRLFRLH